MMRRLLLAACLPFALHAQGAPTNDAPNPYRTIPGWAKMPDGRTWGSTSAVDVDRDGSSIWVAERCGTNNCVDSKLPPVLKFDRDGNLVKSFGSGMLLSPHGIHVARDGSIWVIDCACTLGRTTPAPTDKGHQIYKFSPNGDLLMTLGKAGGGRDSAFFWQPNALLDAPNGDLFVVEGHSSAAGASGRVLKFNKDGKLLATWGHAGSGPEDFDQPHALAMDSKGRLFVGDRGHNRILIYTQDGKLLDTWYQFSRPSGIYIDAKDNIYVADSESGSINPPHGAWKRGIRIGRVADGIVTAFIPDPDPAATGTSAAEGITVDAQGNIYGAEVGPKALKRYVKN